VARWLTRSEPSALVAGMAAVLGHTFSPWVRFRGGKGVAAALGVWLVLAPVPTLIALPTWGIALAVSRRVSVASILAATLLPLAIATTGGAAGRIPKVTLAALLGLLVWVRHRGNLVRLFRGEEPPLWGAGRS
jgi:glycerol-3-phosphate acyltransferase PlsY